MMESYLESKEPFLIKIEDFEKKNMKLIYIYIYVYIYIHIY